VNIYVGNLSYQTTEAELRQAFEAFGEVASVTIIMDKFSGRSRGFGFVEMPVQEEAAAAINGLNGQALGDRDLVVNEARPRENRGGGGGGRPRGGRDRGNGQRRGRGGQSRGRDRDDDTRRSY